MPQPDQPALVLNSSKAVDKTITQVARRESRETEICRSSMEDRQALKQFAIRTPATFVWQLLEQ
jgi:hypothetical protein